MSYSARTHVPISKISITNIRITYNTHTAGLLHLKFLDPCARTLPSYLASYPSTARTHVPISKISITNIRITYNTHTSGPLRSSRVSFWQTIPAGATHARISRLLHSNHISTWQTIPATQLLYSSRTLLSLANYPSAARRHTLCFNRR